MLLSSRVKGVSDSITLQLNELAVHMAEEGRIVYNLSAGQLPIKPPQEFIEKINQQLNFLKSYQYSPVAGLSELRKKILNNHLAARKLAASHGEQLDVALSNGSKHSIYNALGAILDPGDEVVLLVPYWVSYPEMVKFWGGVPVAVKSVVFDGFTPSLEDVERVFTPRTKAIIINSPNNPAGIHYSEAWMKQFAQLMKNHPDIWILSDEIYSDINYFDPLPTYFYQGAPELLERTVIFGGISKCLASTGLRMGWTIGPRSVIQALTRIQGQTTSGPSALIQRALLELDWSVFEKFLDPVKVHLRRSAEILRDQWRGGSLHNGWYQSLSAFYFMLDFSRTPMFERFRTDPQIDRSKEICQELLEKEGIVVVPGGDFGLPNSARMALVMEEVPFTEAVNKMVKYLQRP